MQPLELFSLAYKDCTHEFNFVRKITFKGTLDINIIDMFCVLV